MVDIPRLREIHSVITVGEYLRLQGIDPKIEKLNGHWDLDLYSRLGVTPTRPEGTKNLTSTVLLEANYEPGNVIRVDEIPSRPDLPTPPPDVESGHFFTVLKSGLGEGKTIELNEAKKMIRERELGEWSNDQELERLLASQGWTILYTFHGE
jgi:hypothetical protein